MSSNKTWWNRDWRLKNQNISLLLKWLWLLHARSESLWAIILNKVYSNALTSDANTASIFLKELQGLKQLFQVSIQEFDGVLSWRWEMQGNFTAKSAYLFLSHTGVITHYRYYLVVNRDTQKN
jgi:hypothetical protein